MQERIDERAGLVGHAPDLVVELQHLDRLAHKVDGHVEHALQQLLLLLEQLLLESKRA
jgi:hypothetical protein